MVGKHKIILTEECYIDRQVTTDLVVHTKCPWIKEYWEGRYKPRMTVEDKDSKAEGS